MSNEDEPPKLRLLKRERGFGGDSVGLESPSLRVVKKGERKSVEKVDLKFMADQIEGNSLQIGELLRGARSIEDIDQEALKVFVSINFDQMLRLQTVFGWIPEDIETKEY